MMKKDAMLDALKNKRGNGIDLTILLGNQGDDNDDDNESIGLAPDAEEMTDENAVPEAGMIADELPESEDAMQGKSALMAEEPKDKMPMDKMPMDKMALMQEFMKGSMPIAKRALAMQRK